MAGADGARPAPRRLRSLRPCVATWPIALSSSASRAVVNRQLRSSETLLTGMYHLVHRRSMTTNTFQRSELLIEAEVERVWALTLDVERWPELAPRSPASSASTTAAGGGQPGAHHPARPAPGRLDRQPARARRRLRGGGRRSGPVTMTGGHHLRPDGRGCVNLLRPRYHRSGVAPGRPSRGRRIGARHRAGRTAASRRRRRRASCRPCDEVVMVHGRSTAVGADKLESRWLPRSRRALVSRDGDRRRGRHRLLLRRSLPRRPRRPPSRPPSPRRGPTSPSRSATWAMTSSPPSTWPPTPPCSSAPSRWSPPWSPSPT